MQYHHTTPPEVEDRIDLLLARLEGVRPAGPNSWVARCPAHDDRDPSLSVSVKEGRILVHCFAGCAPDEVLGAVGLTWRDLRAPNPWGWGPFPSRAKPKPEPEAPSPEDRARWEALWEGAKPGHPLLQRYLRARGLSLEPPPTLRVVYLKGEPAMVARVEGPGGLLGLHLTLLEPDGRERKEKRLARGSRPKGGAIRLYPLEAGRPLALAEGIETALAVREATGWPVWATIAAPFMKEVVVPHEVKEVVVCADYDKAGLEAAKALARRLLQEGRRVRLAVPPEEGEDWLDVLVRVKDGAGASRPKEEKMLDSTKKHYTNGIPASGTMTLEEALESPRNAPEVKLEDLEAEESQAWPEPQDLAALEAPLPPWKKGLLPPALEDLAEALGGQLLVEPTAPAVAMLAAVSAVLGYRRVVVAPEPDNPSWEEVPVLWVALIGPPGSGKTPLIREASRPLWAIEHELAEANRRDWEEYEVDLERWQGAKRGERGEKPKPPTPRRLVVSDITPEKLGVILEANPALLVHVDELKGLLQSWRREDRAAGRAFFMSAYHGNSSVIDRVMRGTLYLERPQVAILGGIQPGPWHQVVRGGLGRGEDADGLLQRFTPVVLDPLPPVKEPPPVPKSLLWAYEEAVVRLWEEEVPPRVSPSLEAYSLWKEWRFETLQDQRNPELPEAWRGYLSKRMGLTARLAGILSVLWGEAGVISEGSMARAIYLVKGILEPHARRAWRVGQVGDISPALRLGKKLREGGVERFTRRDVYRNEWGGISSSEEAGQALWLLERAGWVVYDPATKTYWVNPRIREVRGG